jgi:hypothetical protein
MNAPDVFKKVQLVEAVAMLEQYHGQKVKENGAGLHKSVSVQAAETRGGGREHGGLL